MNPMPKSLTPIHFIVFTWLREGPLGEKFLTWGMTHLIGHIDNPPIPKLGKFKRVFEHLFNLKTYFWCTCLGGSCIKCDFTCHDTFDLRPLEGTLICLCKTLFDGQFGGTSPSWAFIGVGSPQVECHDPHFGSSHMMDVSFGGKRWHLGGWHPTFSSPTTFLWRPYTTLLWIDVLMWGQG